MKILFPLFLLSFYFFGIQNSAEAFTPSWGPQATAAEQYKSRHAYVDNIVQATFEAERQDAEDKTSKKETIFVQMASDYVLVKHGQKKTMVDHRLQRMYFIDDNKKLFGNRSVYINLSSRQLELANRRMLRKATAAADIKTPILDKFWSESELGLLDEEGEASAIERKVSADGTVRFLVNGEEVASYLPGPQLTSTEPQAFGRFLHMNLPIHPKIVDDIVASGHLPQNFSFKEYVELKPKVSTWTLVSQQKTKADFPLTADYKAEPTLFMDDYPHYDELKKTIPIVLQAIARSYNKGPRTATAYQAEITKALSESKPFQALLLYFELIMARGQAGGSCAIVAGPCATLPQILAAAQNDERAQALLNSLKIEQAEPQKAIELRRGLSRDDLTNPYIIDVFLANTLAQVDPQSEEPELLFLNAIRRNPYASGFYKDIGDLYVRHDRRPQAWLFYDLGRALPPGDSPPTLSPIYPLELKMGDDLAYLGLGLPKMP